MFKKFIASALAVTMVLAAGVVVSASGADYNPEFGGNDGWTTRPIHCTCCGCC